LLSAEASMGLEQDGEAALELEDGEAALELAGDDVLAGWRAWLHGHSACLATDRGASAWSVELDGQQVVLEVVPNCHITHTAAEACSESVRPPIPPHRA